MCCGSQTHWTLRTGVDESGGTWEPGQELEPPNREQEEERDFGVIRLLFFVAVRLGLYLPLNTLS